MQDNQSTQNNQLPVKLPLVSSTSAQINLMAFPFVRTPNTTNITSIVVGGGLVGPYPNQPLLHMAIKTAIDVSVIPTYTLTHIGNQLATMLVKVLDELEKHNVDAVYPIVSMLEPYVKVNHSINVDVRPKIFREVSINIKRIGKVTPKIHLDESAT